MSGCVCSREWGGAGGGRGAAFGLVDAVNCARIDSDHVAALCLASNGKSKFHKQKDKMNVWNAGIHFDTGLTPTPSVELSVDRSSRDCIVISILPCSKSLVYCKTSNAPVLYHPRHHISA